MISVEFTHIYFSIFIDKKIWYWLNSCSYLYEFKYWCSHTVYHAYIFQHFTIYTNIYVSILRIKRYDIGISRIYISVFMDKKIWYWLNHAPIYTNCILRIYISVSYGWKDMILVEFMLRYVRIVYHAYIFKYFMDKNVWYRLNSWSDIYEYILYDINAYIFQYFM